MRSYYRLLILSVAVVGTLASAILLRMVKINPAVWLVVCLGLLVANYATTQKIARQRGTSSLDIGLWASWVVGPLVFAIFPLMVAMYITKRDIGGVLTLPSVVWVAASAWSTVRNSEREGWGKIDPKGPKSLSDALRG